jgi:hypothetical protein
MLEDRHRGDVGQRLGDGEVVGAGRRSLGTRFSAQTTVPRGRIGR